MPLPPAELTLLQAAARGDAQAWDRLLVTWLPVVLGWCNRLAGPRGEPEDLAHEVLLHTWSELPRIRDLHAFPAWLYRTTRRAVLKVEARRSRRERLLAWFPLPVASVPAPSRDITAGERVLELLQALPVPQREVLVLCFVEEHTREEAAELLDIPVGTVKSRLRLATSRFRELARADGLLDDLHEVVR